MLINPFPKIENIHAIAIPLVSFPELITANVYVLGKGPLTLIDAGPNVDGAMEKPVLLTWALLRYLARRERLGL